MKKQIKFTEDEYDSSIYTTTNWHNSVTVLRWEHDFVKQEYTIDYIEKT